ncbi:MAG: TauD/TfdA family dioxygenase [Ectothiorhodospiraceae bacterium]|nr:TauD/TfdA family dioxygenase [Ectothiorhodospiraceae bacterium]
MVSGSTDFETITVRRVGGVIGATVDGIDLARPLSATQVREVRAALLEHLVLFFSNQSLGPGELLAAARNFGEPSVYPFVKGVDGFPEVTEVLKLETETHNFGGVWHSDTSYLERPPMAGILHARELPPCGGDTVFSSSIAAYESLTPAMQAMLAPLRAVNSSAKADAATGRADRLRDRSSGRREPAEAVHPVVRTHPETGRKSLYVSRGHTLRIEGMTQAESAPLLDYLSDLQTRPEFSYRFRWTPGAVAFWDNRCTQHYAVNDYHGHRRSMLRVTLAGDVPR